MLRFLSLIIALVLCASGLAKDVSVKGYTRKDGTYVAPHVRTAPNSTKSDNYSTKGNVNPYTGKAGTKPGDYTPSTPSAYAPPATSAPAAASTAPAPKTTVTTPSLSTVTLGMTKAQVVAKMGEPNVNGGSSWFYVDRGWVRFRGDAVSAIEAK